MSSIITSSKSRGILKNYPDIQDKRKNPNASTNLRSTLLQSTLFEWQDDDDDNLHVGKTVWDE